MFCFIIYFWFIIKNIDPHASTYIHTFREYDLTFSRGTFFRFSSRFSFVRNVGNKTILLCVSFFLFYFFIYSGSVSLLFFIFLWTMLMSQSGFYNEIWILHIVQLNSRFTLPLCMYVHMYSYSLREKCINCNHSQYFLSTIFIFNVNDKSSTTNSLLYIYSFIIMSDIIGVFLSTWFIWPGTIFLIFS